MVSFLKGRRRDDDAVVAVDSTGANITAALEALVARAEAAAEQLRSLAPVMDRSAELDTLRERCVAVEEQMGGLERLAVQLAAAEELADASPKLSLGPPTASRSCRVSSAPWATRLTAPSSSGTSWMSSSGTKARWLHSALMQRRFESS